ncbi:MAG: sulfurtransferase [Pseudomonadales bacterium]|nr:sulfurtransferase [Pseudomonadales bacterium]
MPAFARLIEPEYLVEHLNTPNLLIVDLSKAQLHAEAHIAGAVHLPASHLLRGLPPAHGLLPDPSTLESILSFLGLQDDTHVIAYDDEGGGWAGRFLWTLELVGHKNYSYLNGGLVAWLAANLPVETTLHLPQPSQYSMTLHTQHLAELDYVLHRLDHEDMVIWDARSPEEFDGTRQFAQRGGHIPGAINYEWTRAMDTSRHLRLRPLEELRAELATLGIVPDKEIITHCQTHHRSGLTWLVGRLLDFPRLRAYAGSWGEWGNLRHTPITTSSD